MFGRGGSLIGIIILILDIWAIVDILKSGKDTTTKILWILLVALFPIVGLVIYVLLGRGNKPLGKI